MRAVIAISDLLARSRLEAAARAAGYEVESARAVPAPDAPEPQVLVVDLDQPGALGALEAWRAAHPTGRVVGFAFHVNREAMAAAEALGVEVVTHGATARAGEIFA